MNRHEPLPPLLLTMIMNAIVIPRTTSRDSSLRAGSGRCTGLVITDQKSVPPACDGAHEAARVEPAKGCAAVGRVRGSHVRGWRKRVSREEPHALAPSRHGAQ